MNTKILLDGREVAIEIHRVQSGGVEVVAKLDRRSYSVAMTPRAVDALMGLLCLPEKKVWAISYPAGTKVETLPASGPTKPPPPPPPLSDKPPELSDRFDMLVGVGTCDRCRRTILVGEFVRMRPLDRSKRGGPYVIDCNGCAAAELLPLHREWTNGPAVATGPDGVARWTRDVAPGEVVEVDAAALQRISGAARIGFWEPGEQEAFDERLRGLIGQQKGTAS